MTSISSPLAIVSLAALVLSCGAMRIRKRTGQEVEQRNSAFDDACPKKVEINTKGDCIDAEGRPVAYRCCDHIRDCLSKIDEVAQYYDERLNFYMGKCEVNPGDLTQNGQDFVVIDETRVCSDSCQGFSFLQEPSRSLDSWEISAECKNEALYQDVITMHYAVVSCLDNAWANCKTTTAALETTMLPSTSPDTTAALETTMLPSTSPDTTAALETTMLPSTSLDTTAALETTMLPSTSPDTTAAPETTMLPSTSPDTTAALETTMLPSTSPDVTSPKPEKCCCGQNPDGFWPDYRQLYPNKAGMYPDYNGFYPNPSQLYPTRAQGNPYLNDMYPDLNGEYPIQAEGHYPGPDLAEYDQYMPIDCGYDACGNILACDSSGKQA